MGSGIDRWSAFQFSNFNNFQFSIFFKFQFSKIIFFQGNVGHFPELPGAYVHYTFLRKDRKGNRGPRSDTLWSAEPNPSPQGHIGHTYKVSWSDRYPLPHQTRLQGHKGSLMRNRVAGYVTCNGGHEQPRSLSTNPTPSRKPSLELIAKSDIGLVSRRLRQQRGKSCLLAFVGVI